MGLNVLLGRDILDLGLGLVFQAPCLVCSDRAAGPRVGALCQACWQALPVAPTTSVLAPGLDHAEALGPYDGVWRDLIHAYKFFGRASLRRPLVDRLYARLDSFGSLDMILCPPPSGVSLSERGRDVVGDLAKGLARRSKIPFLRVLRRSGSRLPQRALGVDARWNNARGAYYSSQPLPGRILLIDDVMASGATMAAMAHAARLAGATWVGALTVARSERGNLGA